jgi:hypothetical protein
MFEPTSDREFHDWRADHPDGFVLNFRSAKNDSSYVVLHKANCGSVGSHVADGGFTQRVYGKACATTVRELETFAMTLGRSDGTFSKRCGQCVPIG